MNLSYQKEACVENFDEAWLAQHHEAIQAELCSRLDLDGCTPDRHDITRCLEELDMHIKVMIRPVAGTFVASEETFAIMKTEILEMKNLQVQEVVFGMTSIDHRLDIGQIAILRDLAYPMNVTIHKAIDSSIDILADLDLLKQLGGIKSVLTSGGKNTAQEGADMLIKMIDLAGEDVEIIPAGKITYDTVDALHQQLYASVYHGRRIVKLDSRDAMG